MKLFKEMIKFTNLLPTIIFAIMGVVGYLDYKHGEEQLWWIPIVCAAFVVIFPIAVYFNMRKKWK